MSWISQWNTDVECRCEPAVKAKELGPLAVASKPGGNVSRLEEAAFDWALLWKLLLPDLPLLAAAVALAIAAAVFNVQLPLKIGQLVNAVAKGDTAALKAKAWGTLLVALGQVRRCFSIWTNFYKSTTTTITTTNTNTHRLV